MIQMDKHPDIAWVDSEENLFCAFSHDYSITKVSYVTYAKAHPFPYSKVEER